MVRATLDRGCHLLGRVPANAKFEVVQTLADGSYLSWIAPDGKSKRKGGTRIQVRVIEYTIAEDDQQQVYRLITDLLDIALFPALLLAREYHQRSRSRNHPGRTQNSSQRAQNANSVEAAPPSRPGNLWLVIGTLGCALPHVPSCTAG